VEETPGAFATVILTGPDPVADRFVDTKGPYANFFEVLLNERGTIVFTASIDGARTGIFTGPDLVSDKVIAIGDPLFGSTLGGFSLVEGGLNDGDQLTFVYFLNNGEQGIAVTTVPEPGVLLAGGLLITCIALRRRGRGAICRS
jgi:hypothetical protein